MQECVTEFLIFVTSESQEICGKDGRKTIIAEDILEGMKNLGFDDYYDMTKWYFKRYKKCQNSLAGKRN